MYRIMIVEDDEVIARAVQQSLVSWGMDAFCVQDFSCVLAEFAVKNPQLVLMDIHLPFFNGFHWCQEIRKVSKVPVIFLSSASDNTNIIMAVNMGGDDFIAKPFDLSVLTAKVQAMLRRTYEFAGETNFLEHRGAMLDTGSGVLNYRGKRIELTKNEWRILQSLLENKGKAVSRDMLMMHLWESVVLALLAAEPQGKTEALPEADGLLARDYQQIIASYERQFQEEQIKMEQKYRDMMEYYTM